MNHLKSNYPHADRCVVAASGLSNSHQPDEGKIKYNAYKHRQRTDTPARSTVQIGLGTEPMKVIRGKRSTHDYRDMSVTNNMNFFHHHNHPNIKRYE